MALCSRPGCQGTQKYIYGVWTACSFRALLPGSTLIFMRLGRATCRARQRRVAWLLSFVYFRGPVASNAEKSPKSATCEKQRDGWLPLLYTSSSWCRSKLTKTTKDSWGVSTQLLPPTHTRTPPPPPHDTRQNAHKRTHAHKTTHKSSPAVGLNACTTPFT